MLPPSAGWQLLVHMQTVLAEQPAVARAVRRLSLHDQLSLTLELLRQADSADTHSPKTLPANVIPFRRR